VKRFVFAAAATAALSGCATTSEVMQKRVDALPEAQRSYMIGVYAVSCLPRGDDCGQGFNSISLNYHDKKSDDWSRLSSIVGDLFGHNTVYDFTDLARQEKGYYFCVGLPSGTWAFNTFNYYNFAGGGSGYSLREENQFDLPFTLAPGEIVYVGKLKVGSRVGKNFLGMTVQGPDALYLSSDPEREIAAALAKCPQNVRARPVRSSVITAAAARGHPMVVDEAAAATKPAQP
jgi:hypothetical protein